MAPQESRFLVSNSRQLAKDTFKHNVVKHTALFHSFHHILLDYLSGKVLQLSIIILEQYKHRYQETCFLCGAGFRSLGTFQG